MLENTASAANWIQITHTRKIGLWLWLSFTAALTLLTLLQTTFGKLGEVLVVAWLWVLVLLVPGLTMLFISVLTNASPSKVNPKAVHSALGLSTLAYLMLALITVLAEPMAVMNGESIEGYLKKSFWWMLPFNGLLLIGFWLVIVRRRPLFLPDEKILLEVATTQANTARDKGQLLRSRCFDEVGAGNLSAAMDLLKQQYSDGRREKNELILLQGEHNNLLRNRDLNLVEPAEAQRQLNRITMAVLQLIGQL